MVERRTVTAFAMFTAFACSIGILTPNAWADTSTNSDEAAFYLQGTCLCDSVPTAQEALGLANGYLDMAGPITGVGYPAGLLFALDSAIGANGVDTHLDQVPAAATMTLAGVSQGAIVLDYVKQSLALHITPVRPETDLTFVTFGDPTNATGGILAKNPLLQLVVPLGPLPTPYATTEIVREYDGLSDWPDRPTALSVTNAIIGVAYVHPYYGADANPAKPGTLKTVTINAAGGITTHYVVPTAELPITEPLRSMGIDTTPIDRWLRSQIDRSYARRPQLTATTNAVTTSASVAPAVRRTTRSSIATATTLLTVGIDHVPAGSRTALPEGTDPTRAASRPRTASSPQDGHDDLHLGAGPRAAATGDTDSAAKTANPSRAITAPPGTQ